MKPGSASDPFDEEPREGDVSEPVVAVDRQPDEDITEDSTNGEDELEASEPPYVLRRKTVKEGREITQLYLRPEFAEEGERAMKRRVEELLGTDVAKLDLREAAYAVAQEHPEEIAALLREWGYEYR